MGCGGSNRTEILLEGDDLELFSAMKLSREEIRRFYQYYLKADMDRSGSINVVELLTVFDVERTRFTERIFSVFDHDGSGKINFREFVMSLWNYCTLGDASLDLFTFDLYDADGSGILSWKEIHVMMKDIYGKAVDTNPHAKQIERELQKIDDRDDLNIAAFQNFVRRHKNLLFPAFNLQNQLRKSVMGEKFWRKASDRRIQLSKGKYVTMSQLMELHLNEDLYRRVIEEGATKKGGLHKNAQKVIAGTGTMHGRQITDEAHYKGSRDSQDMNARRSFDSQDGKVPRSRHGSAALRSSGEYQQEHVHDRRKKRSSGDNAAPINNMFLTNEHLTEMRQSGSRHGSQDAGDHHGGHRSNHGSLKNDQHHKRGSHDGGDHHGGHRSNHSSVKDDRHHHKHGSRDANDHHHGGRSSDKKVVPNG